MASLLATAVSDVEGGWGVSGGSGRGVENQYREAPSRGTSRWPVTVGRGGKGHPTCTRCTWKEGSPLQNWGRK